MEEVSRYSRAVRDLRAPATEEGSSPVKRLPQSAKHCLTVCRCDCSTCINDVPWAVRHQLEWHDLNTAVESTIPKHPGFVDF